MPPLKTPYALIDKHALRRTIGKAPTPEALREQAMPPIREAYGREKKAIAQHFIAEERAGRAIADTSLLVDGVLSLLYETAAPHYADGKHIAVLAVGGYGRGELFPYSDIDLLFIHDEGKDQAGALAQWILYGLWDLSLSVGHAVRTIEETLTHAQQDVTICTNLLDARFVCGDVALFNAFQEKFTAYVAGQSAVDFVERKLAERDARHQRCGDSRYVLEPNLKEGKGGMRDLQTLVWLARYIYGMRAVEELVPLQLLTPEEFVSFQKARDFLWRVRMHLHLLAGRAEERLTFDMQRAVAAAMGYHDDAGRMAVERFMRQYFLVARTVGNLTRSSAPFHPFHTVGPTARISAAVRASSRRSRSGDCTFATKSSMVLGSLASRLKAVRLMSR